MRYVRDGSGLVLLAVSLAALAAAVTSIRERDYLAAMLLSTVGLSVLRASVSLLRPTVGE